MLATTGQSRRRSFLLVSLISLLIVQALVQLSTIESFSLATDGLSSTTLQSEQVKVPENSNNLVTILQNRHLSNGGLAHLKVGRKGLDAVLLVPKRVRDAIVARLEWKNRHSWTKFTLPAYANQSAATPTCKFCPFNGDCINGFYLVSWGAEEAKGLDFGQFTQSKKFLADTQSELQFLARPGVKPGMYTMVVDCELEEAVPKETGGSFTITVDGWMTEASELKIAEKLIDAPLFSNLKEVKFEVHKPFPEDLVGKTKIFNRPVVCGRQLFGSLDARYIDRIVRMNKNQGVAATIMYEMGNSQVHNLDAISQHLEAGDLILVDTRSELQNLYGYLGPIITENAKAAGQWLNRLDCLFRLRQLKPSWVMFSDMDEYPVPGPNSTANTTFADTLNSVPEKRDVVLYSVISGDDQFCAHADGDWKEDEYIAYTQKMDRKVQSGEQPPRKNFPTKYAIRPTTSTLGLRIHFAHGKNYNGVSVSPDLYYFSHNRCVANLKFPPPRKRKPVVKG